jgi:hypothetical protein
MTQYRAKREGITTDLKSGILFLFKIIAVLSRFYV